MRRSRRVSAAFAASTAAGAWSLSPTTRLRAVSAQLFTSNASQYSSRSASVNDSIFSSSSLNGPVRGPA